MRDEPRHSSTNESGPGCSALSTHLGVIAVPVLAVFPVERPGVSVSVISRPVGLDSVLIVVVGRVIVICLVIVRLVVATAH